MFDRISHIGIVVQDMNKSLALWQNTFGFEKVKEYRSESEGIHCVMLAVPGQQQRMVLEFMEPLDKEDMSNPVAKRLKRSGEGFYHLCGVVSDVDATATTLKDKGLTVIARPPATEGDEPRWLTHPKSSNGIIVEGVTEWLEGSMQSD